MYNVIFLSIKELVWKKWYVLLFLFPIPGQQETSRMHPSDIPYKNEIQFGNYILFHN